MYSNSLILALAFLRPGLAFATTPSFGGHGPVPTCASSDSTEALQQLDRLIAHSRQVSFQQLQTAGYDSACTAETILVRREWSTLSAKERIAYTDAVKCLQSKPAHSPSSWAAGARTRYDDWVASHINQTFTIHYTGTFLGWHRYFTWEYEQALRNECGYKGTQPYWNWPLTDKLGFANDPVWNGAPTSMGGNGVRINQTGDIVVGGGGLEPVILPTGTGGGCVETGPFKNWTVNLGPASLSLPGNMTAVNPNGPMAYNPRCLKRDLTDAIIHKFVNGTAIVNTILQHSGIYDFEMTMQGYPGSGNIGIHGGGHYAMGGDPGRDFFVSPGDPAFFLHHAMIDLVWTSWQALGWDERTYGDNAISGTGTFLNTPPSPNTTFETPITLDYAGSGKVVTMRDLMSPVAGPFCYVYA